MRAAPGGIEPESRGRNGKRRSPGRSASGGPGHAAAHLPPPPAAAPPPLPPSRTAAPPLRTLGQRARAQAQVQARLGLWGSRLRGSRFRGWPRGLHGLFALHRSQLRRPVAQHLALAAGVPVSPLSSDPSGGCHYRKPLVPYPTRSKTTSPPPHPIGAPGCHSHRSTLQLPGTLPPSHTHFALKAGH